MQQWIKHLIALCIFLPTIPSVLAQEELGSVKSATVFVTCSYKFPDGSTEVASFGSGAIVSPDGYLLTAKHLVPQNLQGANIECFASIASRHTQKLRIKRQPSATDADAALFKLPDIGVRYSHFTICDPRSMTDGVDRVFAHGFPRDHDYQIKNGTISARDGDGGTWHTSIDMTFGMSGGPVTNDSGLLVGIVIGGSEPGFSAFLPVFHAKPLTDVARSPRCDSTPVQVSEVATPNSNPGSDSDSFEESAPVSCRARDGMFVFSNQTFTSNTKIRHKDICFEDGANIRIENGAELLVKAKTMVFEGQVFLDGKGYQGANGASGSQPPEFVHRPGLFDGNSYDAARCERDMTGFGRSDGDRGRPGEDGHDGGPGAKISLEYEYFKGNTAGLRHDVSGGLPGGGGPGGKGRILRCLHDAPGTARMQGLSGHEGKDGESGPAGEFVFGQVSWN